MKLLKFIIFISFALFMTSCEVKDVNVNAPNNIEIQELSFKNIKIKIYLPIENKNNFSFKIKDVNLDLFVNDIAIGKVNKIENLKIEANSKNVYPIYFEISTKDAISNIMVLFNELKKNEPKLDINGYIKVSKFLIIKKIKVDFSHNENTI